MPRPYFVRGVLHLRTPTPYSAATVYTPRPNPHHPTTRIELSVGTYSLLSQRFVLPYSSYECTRRHARSAMPTHAPVADVSLSVRRRRVAVPVASVRARCSGGPRVQQRAGSRLCKHQRSTRHVSWILEMLQSDFEARYDTAWFSKRFVEAAQRML